MVQAQKGGRPSTPSGMEDYERPEWRQPTEAELEMQFNMLPRANAQQVGMEQNISRMPPELREIVNWAEQQKKEHSGLN